MTAYPLTRYRLGIVGGLGPLASADLYERITRLTPAAGDWDHFATVLLSIPQTLDRTAAICGNGPSPLPQLLDAINTLNSLRVELVAVGCNTAHHWYDMLAEASHAPILHIADAALAALETDAAGKPVAIFASRGVITSGFYQRKLEALGFPPQIPDEQMQSLVDAAIAAVKAGELSRAAQALSAAVSGLKDLAIPIVLLACTELPIAWTHIVGATALQVRVIDVNATFARAIVRCLSGDPAPAKSRLVRACLDTVRDISAPIESKRKGL